MENCAKTRNFADMEELGFVYVVHSKLLDAYKIGFSTNPKERIRTIGEMYGGVTLERLYSLKTRKNAMRCEKRLHHWFKQTRFFGEWFKINNGEVQAIDVIVRQFFARAVSIESATKMVQAANRKNAKAAKTFFAQKHIAQIQPNSIGEKWREYQDSFFAKDKKKR